MPTVPEGRFNQREENLIAYLSLKDCDDKRYRKNCGSD